MQRPMIDCLTGVSMRLTRMRSNEQAEYGVTSGYTLRRIDTNDIVAIVVNGEIFDPHGNRFDFT